jgi:hypothetical protein
MFLYWPVVFLISRVTQELIPINYDKHRMSNIITRFIHGLGCSYYLLPALKNQEILMLDVNSINIPSDIQFVLTRSANFFIWDTISLLLSSEENKLMFSLHHLICSLCISYSLYFEINWYFVSVALFIGELTNPITQISDLCLLFNYYNIRIEKFYFASMLLIRGIISPCLIIMTNYNLLFLYGIYGSEILYNRSLLLNYFTLISITAPSIDWLNNKYGEIIDEIKNN